MVHDGAYLTISTSCKLAGFVLQSQSKFVHSSLLPIDRVSACHEFTLLQGFLSTELLVNIMEKEKHVMRI